MQQVHKSKSVAEDQHDIHVDFIALCVSAYRAAEHLGGPVIGDLFGIVRVTFFC